MWCCRDLVMACRFISHWRGRGGCAGMMNRELTPVNSLRHQVKSWRVSSRLNSNRVPDL